MEVEAEVDEQETRGRVVKVDVATGTVPIKTRAGASIELEVTPPAHIKIKDGLELLEELREGDQAEVKIVAGTRQLLRIEAKESEDIEARELKGKVFSVEWPPGW